MSIKNPLSNPMRKKGRDWKVTFKDPAAKDKAKQTLYVFFTLPTIPACPSCAMENNYPDGDNHVCADCGHEWPMVKDANGNVPADGDQARVAPVVRGAR